MDANFTAGGSNQSDITDPEEGNAPCPSRARLAKEELLQRISEFVLKHDLNVTGHNMAVICNAISGSNHELAEMFAQREIRREPIDQRWLDTVTRFEPDAMSKMTELERLSDKLDYLLTRSAQAVKHAQSEASDHSGALNAQITKLSEFGVGNEGESPLVQVLEISKAMLDRVKQVEQSMARNRAETDSLRDNLTKARMEASVDHLTGLPNRRAFERRFASAAKEAHDNDQPLSVAFCDVDHFKSINDKHGHDAGDRVLCSLSSTLIEHASDDCFVSRHGGEEFVLLFYGFNKYEAAEKLDRIRRAQAAKQFINRENGRSFGKVTFSGGVAEVGDDTDIRSALVRADKALYEAKNGGRNKVIVN